MVTDNQEGVAYAADESKNYGFLMESKSIEYETERNCNLTQVGDPLDDKNYGIGMRKGISCWFIIMAQKIQYFSIGFKFHSQLSEGVLQLQEKGILATLYKKWWKERRGGGACSVTQFVFISQHIQTLLM